MSDQLSPELAAFVAQAPAAREPHVPFLRAAVEGLAPGSLVLDVGAGEAPYRELFSAFDYRTTDWAGSFYTPSHGVDYVAPAHDMPLDDDSVDAVVCTQVLEHVAEPVEVLVELRRVLRPGGRLIVTAPLTWYLHELPHDYYRYTAYGLRHVLAKAGFAEIDIHPMNDSPSTIGALLREARWLLGSAETDGLDERRVAAGDLLAQAATMVESIGWLDTQWLMPISFSATARNPQETAG
ncbi:methyltransferase domain-containing protein [Nocardioides cavernae]|uniref:Methyltransferase domain-containing protein n=1 Tax=Nocardioides cavernae TaxID=1921566 RepID=A0ABR8NBA4_9ACTN|nr:methyltransferase domain-containing protein [Nocardioides cavernae]MBD3923749.1 methyltransferase domain-containing protein [Nocardioides cavernae]MBM7511318.1 SAM-dependent methyltransferase [Nocardioides cavernae]